MPNWIVVINRRKIGPIPSGVLRQLAKAGCVQPDSPVRQETSESWVYARKVRGLEFRSASAPLRASGTAGFGESDTQIAPSPSVTAPYQGGAAARDSARRAWHFQARHSALVRFAALSPTARFAVLGGTGCVVLVVLIVIGGVVAGLKRNAGGDGRSASIGSAATATIPATQRPAVGGAAEAKADQKGSVAPTGSLSGRSGDIEFTLVSYDFRDSILSSPPLTPVEYAQTIKPTGHFLVLGIEVKNLGDDPETIDASDVFSLRDSQGRRFEVSQEGREALAMQNREILLAKSINPRMAVRAIVPFDVPSKEVFEVVASTGAFAGKAVLNIDLLMEKDRAAEFARLKKLEERGKLRSEAMQPGKVLATYKVTADVPLGPARLRDDAKQLDPVRDNLKTWPTASGSGTIELTEGGVRISGFSQPADIPEYISYNRFFAFISARNRESAVPGANRFMREIKGGFMLAPGSKAPPTTNITIQNPTDVCMRFPEALERGGPQVVVSFASIEECDAFLAAVQRAYDTWAQRFPRAAADEQFGTPENDTMDSMGDGK
jgi:hypothetical protein